MVGEGINTWCPLNLRVTYLRREAGGWAGGCSSQTACSRCMNSLQLWSGRQPPQSPRPTLPTALPDSCLHRFYSRGFLQKRRDLQDPNCNLLQTAFKWCRECPHPLIVLFFSLSFFLWKKPPGFSRCFTDTCSLLPQARPRLQRGGSSASLHNSLMRNSIFQLMIHTLDPLSEGNGS